jgi:hypothetical protein
MSYEYFSRRLFFWSAISPSFLDLFTPLFGSPFLVGSLKNQEILLLKSIVFSKYNCPTLDRLPKICNYEGSHQAGSQYQEAMQTWVWSTH